MSGCNHIKCCCGGAVVCGHCGGGWVYVYIKTGLMVQVIRGPMPGCVYDSYGTQCYWYDGAPHSDDYYVSVNDVDTGWLVYSDITGTTGTSSMSCTTAHWTQGNSEYWLVRASAEAGIPAAPACSGSAPNPPF